MDGRCILPLILAVASSAAWSEGSRLLPWPFVIPCGHFSTGVLVNQRELGGYTAPAGRQVYHESGQLEPHDVISRQGQPLARLGFPRAQVCQPVDNLLCGDAGRELGCHDPGVE